MQDFDNNAIVLKHSLATRLFHWCLVLGFLPAAFTGIVLFLRPFLYSFGYPLGDSFMHLVMQIHIIGAWILTLSCVWFFFFQPKRVAAFWREIFDWSKRDVDWLKVGGGYPQKMFLGKKIPVPPMRKMNSGQKMMGVMVFFGTIIIVVTGLILYIALPLVPKQIAYWADIIHLVVGLGLTLCVVFGHIPLGIYNWKEFICMFGNGRLAMHIAKEHNELWVKEDIESVSKK